jgi:transcriptional regulator with XRE-family HTH domain
MEEPARRPIDPLDASIGERIRVLRRQRGLSLQQVAQAAEVSLGYLSQIERGLSSPSVRDLMRVAVALRVDISFFFEAAAPGGEGTDPIVVRVAERQEVAFQAGITKQRLTPPGRASLQVYLITLEPGGRSGEALYAHDGEEAGLVLQGRLHLTVEDRDFLLNEGDSFRFLSRRPHRFANAASTVARVVWVNVAPPVAADSAGEPAP